MMATKTDDTRPSLDQIAAALHEQGAWCGDCDFDGWLECHGCRTVLTAYGCAVLALFAQEQSDKPDMLKGQR